MKFLLDTNLEKVDAFNRLSGGTEYGQLLTPLTFYKRWSDYFAIDNGCYGGLDARAFFSLLEREKHAADKCLFVCNPDIVGNAKRTMELWKRRDQFIPGCYTMALVAQNGLEDIDIPWHEFKAIFVGGKDPWKESQGCIDIVKTAKMLGKHVHIGRVNSKARFDLFSELGADTCDGSGVSRFPDKMVPGIFGKTDNVCDLIENMYER